MECRGRSSIIDRLGRNGAVSVVADIHLRAIRGLIRHVRTIRIVRELLLPDGIAVALRAIGAQIIERVAQIAKQDATVGIIGCGADHLSACIQQIKPELIRFEIAALKLLVRLQSHSAGCTIRVGELRMRGLARLDVALVAHAPGKHEAGGLLLDYAIGALGWDLLDGRRLAVLELEGSAIGNPPARERGARIRIGNNHVIVLPGIGFALRRFQIKAERERGVGAQGRCSQNLLGDGEVAKRVIDVLHVGSVRLRGVPSVVRVFVNLVLHQFAVVIVLVEVVKGVGPLALAIRTDGLGLDLGLDVALDPIQVDLDRLGAASRGVLRVLPRLDARDARLLRRVRVRHRRDLRVAARASLVPRHAPGVAGHVILAQRVADRVALVVHTAHALKGVLPAVGIAQLGGHAAFPTIRQQVHRHRLRALAILIVPVVPHLLDHNAAIQQANLGVILPHELVLGGGPGGLVDFPRHARDVVVRMRATTEAVVIGLRVALLKLGVKPLLSRICLIKVAYHGCLHLDERAHGHAGLEYEILAVLGLAAVDGNAGDLCGIAWLLGGPDVAVLKVEIRLERAVLATHIRLIVERQICLGAVIHHGLHTLGDQRRNIDALQNAAPLAVAGIGAAVLLGWNEILQIVVQDDALELCLVIILDAQPVRVCTALVHIEGVRVQAFAIHAIVVHAHVLLQARERAHVDAHRVAAIAVHEHRVVVIGIEVGHELLNALYGTGGRLVLARERVIGLARKALHGAQAVVARLERDDIVELNAQVGHVLPGVHGIKVKLDDVAVARFARDAHVVVFAHVLVTRRRLLVLGLRAQHGLHHQQRTAAALVVLHGVGIAQRVALAQLDRIEVGNHVLGKQVVERPRGLRLDDAAINRLVVLLLGNEVRLLLHLGGVVQPCETVGDVVLLRHALKGAHTQRHARQLVVRRLDLRGQNLAPVAAVLIRAHDRLVAYGRRGARRVLE